MGTAGLFTVFWIRLILAGIWVGVPLLFGLILTWWTTRKRTAGARHRLIGLGVGALVGVLLVWAPALWLSPIAVVAGYLGGVYVGELRDGPEPTGSVRRASLRPRTVGGYVPLWAKVVAVVAGVLTMVTPVVLIALPTASYGPWHPFSDAFTLPGETLRWPPVRDWLPLVVVAGGGLVIGALLVRRVLGRPADPADPDDTGRRAAVRLVMATVLGVELLALGAQTLFASAGLAVPAQVGGAAYVGSRVLIWTGVGFALSGIVVWWLMGSRRGRPAPPDPVPQA